jgi:hypothetical protein
VSSGFTLFRFCTSSPPESEASVPNFGFPEHLLSRAVAVVTFPFTFPMDSQIPHTLLQFYLRYLSHSCFRIICMGRLIAQSWAIWVVFICFGLDILMYFVLFTLWPHYCWAKPWRPKRAMVRPNLASVLKRSMLRNRPIFHPVATRKDKYQARTSIRFV